MHVLEIIRWWMLVYMTGHSCATTTESPDHEDVDDAVNYTNASYTTSELRDQALEELKGKTEEIQAYFDQLPSEEFKENSEDLKFKLYYERKGLKDIDSSQVFNITPEVREPPSVVYSIEVNDSYVPKYRITSSEEERMDKYGMFSSESVSSDAAKKKKKKKKKKSKGSSESESGGKKSKKEKVKKKSSKNVDSKEKRKKKKKSKSDEKEKKKNKELVDTKLNNLKGVKVEDLKARAIHLRSQHNDITLGTNVQAKNQGKHQISTNERNGKTRNINNKIETNVLPNSNLHLESETNSKRMKIKPASRKLIDNNEIELKLRTIRRQRLRKPQNDRLPRPFV